MITPELQNYIIGARAANMSDDAIRQELLRTGWMVTDVNQALGMNVGQQSEQFQPKTTAPDAGFIQRWSWGGFFLTWVYFLASRMYKKSILYFFGLLVPLLNLYLII